jgi:hypothetical protein
MVRLDIINIVKPESMDISIEDVQSGMHYKPFSSGEIIDNFEKKKTSYLFPSYKIRVTVEFSKTSRSSQPLLQFAYKAERRVIDRMQPELREDHIFQFNLTSGNIVMPKSLIKEKIVWLIKAPKEYQVIARIKSSTSSESRFGQLIFSMLGK